MSRLRGLDPTGLRAAVALALLAALANAAWILLDHTAPAWDQAHYLTVALQYQHALESEGPAGLLHAIYSVDTSHGPLFPILLVPFLGLLGASARSAMVLNALLAPVLYLAAGQIAWIVFRSWVARLLTILLVATMPLLVGLYHNAFQDFLLATLATVSVLLLLRSERLQLRWACVALGLTMGFGSLAKVTFPLFLIGPLLVVAVQLVATHRRDGDRVSLGTAGVNAALGAGVYLLLVLPWYLPNLEATREYATSTTSGPLSVGAGPKHPLNFHAIASFTADAVDSDLSWIVALAAIVALVSILSQAPELWRRLRSSERAWQLAALFAWALVPYLTLATAHNQDVRLMAAAMPAIAAIVAGAIAAIRWRTARRATIALTTLALCFQTLNHTVSVSSTPQTLSVSVGAYPAVLHLGDEPIGYEHLPGSDYATPIVEYIGRLARRQIVAGTTPVVCVLETEPLVNGNTLEFAAEARHIPLSFVGVLANEEGTDLSAALAKCDIALYSQQRPPPAGLEEVRMTLVNREYAASAMTPSHLAEFKGPRRYFPTGTAPLIEGEDKWASVAGKADRVLVLSNLGPQ